MKKREMRQKIAGNQRRNRVEIKLGDRMGRFVMHLTVPLHCNSNQVTLNIVDLQSSLLSCEGV